MKALRRKDTKEWLAKTIFADKITGDHPMPIRYDSIEEMERFYKEKCQIDLDLSEYEMVDIEIIALPDVYKKNAEIMFPLHTHVEIAHQQNPDQIVYREEDVLKIITQVRSQYTGIMSEDDFIKILEAVDYPMTISEEATWRYVWQNRNNPEALKGTRSKFQQS